MPLPPSEVPLALFLLHRGGLVAVDEAARALRGARDQHLLDDVVEARGLALDGRRERIATERAEAHHPHLLDLAGLQRHAIVIAHDEESVALDHRAGSGEVERYHRNLLGAGVVPDVELRPVGKREDADGLALADARVVEIPDRK